jgi:pimeloyl-ACP methyl ester carboxylesterase
MKIFLLPGLGFDCRIFRKIDLTGYDIEHINWVDPIQGESFREYCHRLFKNRVVQNKKIVLIGYSFGGLVAQEIATLYDIYEVVLISSLKFDNEKPLHFKLVNRLRIDRIFTKELSVRSIPYWGKLNGVLNDDDFELFESMLMAQSNTYLQWALRALSGWKSPTTNCKTKIFQIHGELDRTFPVRLLKEPDVVVKNGGHLMIYRQAMEVREIVINELKKSPLGADGLVLKLGKMCNDE